MTLVRAAAALAIVLASETLFGRLAPAALGWTDLMLIPVAWYAIQRSQRSAMLMGCAGGLLEDAWFGAGVLGMNGFRKTLLGWALGGLGSRLDLNHFPGHFLAGAGLSLGDRLLEVGLHRLLDLSIAPVSPVRLTVRALVTGLLVAATFPIVNRVARRAGVREPARHRG